VGVIHVAELLKAVVPEVEGVGYGSPPHLPFL
jgi:hypothetical protein